jgi:hypothetical protein
MSHIQYLDVLALEARELTDWWRVAPGVKWLHKDLRFKPGASGLLGFAQAGDDPSAQAQLRSSMDLGRSMSFDVSLQHVSALPDPITPGYYDLSARYAWRVSRTVDFSVSGFNLTHARHIEFAVADGGEEITRSFIAEARALLSDAARAGSYWEAEPCCAASASAMLLWCSSVGSVFCAKAPKSGSVLAPASLLKSATASSWSATICLQ